jgi:uncharacterized OB-fold protein
VPVKPSPEPDAVTDFYWQGAAAGELRVSRCVPHGHLSHPPEVSCPACGSEELEPVAVSGRGSVYSFTVVRQAFDPAFLPDVPYAIALVELDEHPGLRVLSNIVECHIAAIEVGMPVEVTFEHRDGYALPQFRPRVRARDSS